nr:ABC transporter transmembrane domain-containing protein [Rhizobium sp. BK275]
MIGAVASIASPYLFSRAVDDLTTVGEHGDAIGTLLLYALLFAIATGFGQASRFLIFLCAERLCFIANSAFFARILRKNRHSFSTTMQPRSARRSSRERRLSTSSRSSLLAACCPASSRLRSVQAFSAIP